MSRVAALVGVFLAVAGSATAQSGRSPSAPAQSFPPAPRSADTCGATPLAGLIGQTRSQIPIADDFRKRRVVCSTCPRTMEYRPERLTVFFDARSNRVTTLQCG